MNEQKDIAVELGVVVMPPPELPEIVTLRELVANPQPTPPLIIDGILHQGCKMILGGTSKSNKSWCLLDLALSVASGQPWWGRPCVKLRVLYINFELQPWAIAKRMEALRARRPECGDAADQLHFWNLRGSAADITDLLSHLEERLQDSNYGLIIIDPVYKLLGDRDENSNGDIAQLMNELETLAQHTGAALVIAHHYAKGDSSNKGAADRMSGAGAWVRDPDSVMVMTPHEQNNCFTVTSILRNLPQVPEFVVEWDFPVMRIEPDLNPASLLKPQAKNKMCSDATFIEQAIGDGVASNKAIVREAKDLLGMSPRTVNSYLKRLTNNGILVKSEEGYRASKPLQSPPK